MREGPAWCQVQGVVPWWAGVGARQGGGVGREKEDLTGVKYKVWCP